ncbi:MAG: response regulator [Mycobacterium sp.]|uniref:response regulator n=1 Tax=Mycobacterium sp. TaxID=1785 RepID=UPI003F9E4589
MTLRVKPLRCFIIDDSPDFIVAATNLLERDGITVVGVTTSGAEAIRSVERLRPDVTLIDVDLGGESGFDLARQLRQRNSPAAQSALILMSAHAKEDFAAMLAASPAVGFVTKTALSASAIRELISGYDVPQRR